MCLNVSLWTGQVQESPPPSLGAVGPSNDRMFICSARSRGVQELGGLPVIEYRGRLATDSI